MSPREHVDESDLHAFVDGELDAENRRRIEDHLHSHAEDAALVEGWRRQNAALRAAFAQTVKEPVPAGLRTASVTSLTRSFGSGVNWARFSPSKGASLRAMRRSDTSRRLPRRPAIVMSLLTLLAGAVVAGAALLAFTGPASPPAPAQRAIIEPPGLVAHAQLAYQTFAQDARPVEIGADRKAELSTWLGERAGFGRLPDLSAAGLELIGGRLVPGVLAPAGLLIYQSSAGAKVALYFERAGGERPSAAPPKTAPGLSAVEWRAVGFAFILIGPLAVETARTAAESAATQASH
ncbi:anti-sigma factor [Methylosinus sp. H3A]|uniref:anti-sigma factor family protein n=1 Tax=Methylosinus sp. H3A TaxID=2785786 RepID=UPI0018C347F0|nr:zf-HC2 domain-containing protein [Methylosinus sp. H3A]MBG0809474.1 anti-sigma factor [Methylosinus sp. H3A]